MTVFVQNFNNTCNLR